MFFDLLGLEANQSPVSQPPISSTAIHKFASGFNEHSASSRTPPITVYGLLITGTSLLIISFIHDEA